ncbi:hypothetical protein [Bifidobacterium biavatii]|nr:hypothetical protein [Bifidobacterium biavatii]
MASATVSPAVKKSGDEIPFNKHVAQHREPADWVDMTWFLFRVLSH